VGRNGPDYLIEMPSDRVIREMHPDLPRLAEVEANLIIVTAPSSTDEYDFVSRVFAPALGIPEDPVTGAAHCVLGPYWAERLGKDELVGYQASARGGVVRVQPQGERILLGGNAVTTMRAELLA
jgi:predicted PhzF superfamily epimerase YddE/YHI9